MFYRIIRPTLVTLLIVAGIISAGFLWFTQQRLGLDRQQSAAVDARVDVLIGGLDDLSDALQAYVAPGQNVTEFPARATDLLKQLGHRAEALASIPGSAEVIEALRPALELLTKMESRVREYLRSGDYLMAADLAFNETRGPLSGAESALRDFRSERQALVVRQAQAAPMQQAAALGVILLAWAFSLIVLAWGRGRVEVPAELSATDAAMTEDGAASDVFSLSLDLAPRLMDPVHADLEAAAGACGDFARASEGRQLKAALGLGAEALGAKGIVVWLGVGDELFAVVSSGYDERHLQRPISRDATNVTAEAWRSAKAILVPGDAENPGVVVVPMIGAAGCRGVVSAELLVGRPANAEREALLAMFAAQLVGLVGVRAGAADEPQGSAVQQASDQSVAERAG
jgi:hypothetical protein